MRGGDWSGHLYEEKKIRFRIEEKDTISRVDWNCSRSERRVHTSRLRKRKDSLTQDMKDRILFDVIDHTGSRPLRISAAEQHLGHSTVRWCSLSNNFTRVSTTC